MITLLIGCNHSAKEDSTPSIPSDKTVTKKIITAVSIVPQKTFVKAVGGDLVDVIVMIPPGHSPANYQPTPQQMVEFSNAKVYFSIGVPTEQANILPKASELNANIHIVHLSEKVDAVYPPRMIEKNNNDTHEAHNHTSQDPHIWLSPKRVVIMIEAVKEELIALDPENKNFYEKNAKTYIAQLQDLDHDIKETLKGVNSKSFIIYHPAFGYFADDYGLEMITIEENGKESTAKKLQSVINLAKKENIKFIFYQEEFDSKQAETIANEINGATIKVAPLSPDYQKNLRNIANTFKKILQ